MFRLFERRRQEVGGRRVLRTLQLRFGHFGWQAVHEAAGTLDKDPDGFIEEACLAYQQRLFGTALSLQTPPFARIGGAVRDVAVSAPRELWDDLQLEAGRQGVELTRLVEHAVVLHLVKPSSRLREPILT